MKFNLKKFNLKNAEVVRTIIAETVATKNPGITPVIIDGTEYDQYGAYKVEITGVTEDGYYTRKNDCKAKKA